MAKSCRSGRLRQKRERTFVCLVRKIVCRCHAMGASRLLGSRLTGVGRKYSQNRKQNVKTMKDSSPTEANLFCTKFTVLPDALVKLGALMLVAVCSLGLLRGDAHWPQVAEKSGNIRPVGKYSCPWSARSSQLDAIHLSPGPCLDGRAGHKLLDGSRLHCCRPLGPHFLILPRDRFSFKSGDRKKAASKQIVQAIEVSIPLLQLFATNTTNDSAPEVAAPPAPVGRRCFLSLSVARAIWEEVDFGTR